MDNFLIFPPIVPGFHGADCPYNGENPAFELGCDECPEYLSCFPDCYAAFTEEAADP